MWQGVDGQGGAQLGQVWCGRVRSGKVGLLSFLIMKGRKMLELSEIKKDVTWQQAMDYAVELGEGWRLPTKQEMFAILAANGSKEFATEGWFWSDSTSLICTDFAWSVNFYNCYAGYISKVDTYHARCIRGSFEDLLTWCFGNSAIHQVNNLLYCTCGGPTIVSGFGKKTFKVCTKCKKEQI
jgi:hypothetical protein